MQSVKKWGLSACTMTTSKKSLQFFPTMCVIPLSLRMGEKNMTLTDCSWTFNLHLSQSGLIKTWASNKQNLHKAEGTVGNEE